MVSPSSPMISCALSHSPLLVPVATHPPTPSITAAAIPLTLALVGTYLPRRWWQACRCSPVCPGPPVRGPGDPGRFGAIPCQCLRHPVMSLPYASDPHGYIPPAFFSSTPEYFTSVRAVGGDPRGFLAGWAEIIHHVSAVTATTAYQPDTIAAARSC